MPHINEKIDFTVQVFIVHNNTVLLRKRDKYGIWLGVGGHIEPDEDPNQAAIREVKEEVGLDVQLSAQKLPDWHSENEERELAAPKFLNRHRINDAHEHVDLIYFAMTNTNEVVAGGEDKSEEWRWFTKQELEQNTYGIKKNIVFYAQKALEELGRG